MNTMKPGDIIIFEAENSWLSKAIAKLTDSSVSHAAMKYTDDAMVEMGSSGIQLNGCYESSTGTPAYLLRLSPEKDPAPLIAAADKYLQEAVSYDFPDLIFFAGLLIYRGVRPTPRWQKITDLVLNAACAALDQALNHLIHKGSKHPFMVCSQLVYQCYLDCGADYEIVLKNALLQNTAHGKIQIANLLHEIPASSPARPGTTREPSDLDLESIAHELCDAIEEAAASTVPLPNIENLHSTVHSAKKFVDLMERMLEQSDLAIPVPALFVAPSDLLNHAVNLRQYGTAHISREKP